MRNHNNGMKLPLRLTVILSGTLLLAFTYYHINYQNHLTEGGFVGLALLGKYVLGISPSISTLLLDIPVLIIAIIFKGKSFVMNTVISVIAFTLFYGLMERYSGWVIDLQDNLPLAALLSGVLTGLGAGMILRGGGASGGDDILSLLISEWKGIKVGTVFILMDVIVLALSLIYMPLKETLYTVMAVVVAGYVITLTTTLGKPKLNKVPKLQPQLSKPQDSTVA
ncbi:YitT family protein [Paenibacillus sp. FSL R7-0331]|uniref:YitT family protein n=1 Tax=Paenibacillus sp. FSL R7-0331 TaxID=1536773 RepID=UPI0004F721DE|nr:YitT family protein [Paenibacillus sp. FSL R7-0331]AIQ53903.1 membrane protein [Paenibacillus sp. FSL R7-0331]